MKKYRQLRPRAIAALGLALSILSANASAAAYQLKDMGLLPGYGASIAYDINDSGAVSLTFSQPEGVIWEAAVYSPAGVLTGVGRPQTWSYSGAGGINNLGHITGEAMIEGPGQVVLATTPQGVRTLSQGVGYAINDSGQITGFSPGGAEPWWSSQATLWTNGNRKALGILGTGVRSAGSDINNAGRVAGYSETTPLGDERAFFYDGQTLRNLGTLPGGTVSTARGINELDQVTGCANSASSTDCHAVIWSGGQIHDLGLIDGGTYSYGLEINDAGEVVGGADIAGGQRVAMLYKGGAMFDLNGLLDAQTASSWRLLEATAINNRGWIVGEAEFNGVRRAFMLTPVPEPGTATLMLAGLAGIGVLGARRRSSKASN